MYGAVIVYQALPMPRDTASTMRYAGRLSFETTRSVPCGLACNIRLKSNNFGKYAASDPARGRWEVLGTTHGILQPLAMVAQSLQYFLEI